MMKNESKLVNKYRSIAEGILKNEISADLVYHTLDHTRSVVTSLIDIGVGSNLSEKDLELGSISAWFHDTGYSRGTKSHENSSIELFTKSIEEGDFSEDDITVIQSLIQCTKMPQTPTTTLEKCLCDADLHHLGTIEFFDKSSLLKKETENDSGKNISKETWNRESYYFLKEHSFYTPYASEHYGAQKEANIEELRGKVKEFAKQDKYLKSLESKMSKLNEKLLQKPSRGIETMFRITSRNHLQLSSMADSKANIMISINTILISVVMTLGSSRIADYPDLMMPVGFLVTVCLTTIVLAVLATRPSVSKGTFTKDDIMNKKTNLLFFGNFHGMDIDDYQWGVSEMMKDADYLYSSLTRDVFFLGKVLAKKYRMLRYAYTTFMIGFTISILLFLLTMLLNHSADL